MSIFIHKIKLILFLNSCMHILLPSLVVYRYIQFFLLMIACWFWFTTFFMLKYTFVFYIFYTTFILAYTLSINKRTFFLLLLFLIYIQFQKHVYYLFNFMFTINKYWFISIINTVFIYNSLLRVIWLVG